MAKGLKEWLAPFIATELQAVIEWHSSGKGVKRDPDSRFSDDGSNFRSAVSSPPLSLETRLQITEVLAHDQTALVILSDGAHSVRASLSKDAVAILQSEIEEKLSSETTGDVFAVTTATVTSTPYGAQEGRIQLQVEDIQYAHHLRKTAGNPVPVTQHDRVAPLLEEITKLRQKQYGEVEEVDEEPSSQLAASQTNSSSAARSQAFATQTPPARKKKSTAPSLTTEGFEVNPGINLNRPTVASKATSKRPAQASVQAGSSTTKPAQLLNLLGGPRAAPAREQPAPTSTQPNQPARVGATPLKSAQIAPAAVNGSKESAASRDVARSGGFAEKHADPPPSKKRRLSGRQDFAKRLPYGRRKIPEIQQRLLDRKASWLPSLPGYTYPEPNVPIELLSVWNEKMKRSPQKASPLRPSQLMAKSLSKPASSGTEWQTVGQTLVDVEAASSDSDTSEDEPISQWSPSPPPAASALPPDSTMDSSGDASQRNSIQGSPTKAPTAPRAMRQSANSSRPLDGSPASQSDGSLDFRSERSILEQPSVTRSLPVRSPVKIDMRPPARPSDDGSRPFDSFATIENARKQGAQPSTPPGSQGSRTTPRSSFDRHMSGASSGLIIEPQTQRPIAVPTRTSANSTRISQSPHENSRSSRSYDSYRPDGSGPQARGSLRQDSRPSAETPRGPRSSESASHSPRYSDLYRPSPSQPHTQRTTGPPGTIDSESPYTRFWNERSTAPKPPTPMRHPLPPRPPPPASDSETLVKSSQASIEDPTTPAKNMRLPTAQQETLVKSTQPMVTNLDGSDGREVNEDDDEDAMELNVPRPLQNPAEAHREKRRQHMRAAQRRTWLKNTCEFVRPPQNSSDPAPTQAEIASWASIIHTAYCGTHENDPVTWNEFRQAIKGCFPGYDKLPRCGVSFKVGGGKKADAAPSQQDGRAMAAGHGVVCRGKGKGRAKAEESVRSTRDDVEMVDNIADNMGVDGRASRGEGERVNGGGSKNTRGQSTIPTKPGRRQEAGKPMHKGRERSMQSNLPPATVFGEFVEAWRSTKPGGAFAKPTRNRAREQRPQMDILGWKL